MTAKHNMWHVRHQLNKIFHFCAWIWSKHVEQQTAFCVWFFFHLHSMISCLTLVSKIWILRRVTSAKGSDSPWVQECVSGTCCTDAAQGQRKKKKWKGCAVICTCRILSWSAFRPCAEQRKDKQQFGECKAFLLVQKNDDKHFKSYKVAWNVILNALSPLKTMCTISLDLKTYSNRMFSADRATLGRTQRSGLLVVAGTGGRTSLAVPPTRGHYGTLLAVKCSELAGQSSPTKTFSGGRHLTWRWADRTLLVFYTVGFITKIFFSIKKFKGNAMLGIVVSSIASYPLGLLILVRSLDFEHKTHHCYSDYLSCLYVCSCFCYFKK